MKTYLKIPSQIELDILSIKGMLMVAEDSLKVSRHSPLDESRYDGEVEALKRVLRVLEPPKLGSLVTYNKDKTEGYVPLDESFSFMDNGRK